MCFGPIDITFQTPEISSHPVQVHCAPSFTPPSTDAAHCYSTHSARSADLSGVALPTGYGACRFARHAAAGGLGPGEALDLVPIRGLVWEGLEGGAQKGPVVFWIVVWLGWKS